MNIRIPAHFQILPSQASAEVLANFGIHPIQSPGAQWILNSPAPTKAVIRFWG
jgi:hypothetical protein